MVAAKNGHTRATPLLSGNLCPVGGKVHGKVAERYVGEYEERRKGRNKVTVLVPGPR